MTTYCEHCDAETIKPPNFEDDGEEDLELYGAFGPCKVIILVCTDCHRVYFKDYKDAPPAETVYREKADPPGGGVSS